MSGNKRIREWNSVRNIKSTRGQRWGSYIHFRYNFFCSLRCCNI